MARREIEMSTDIPARLDRLPWSGWHWRVVVALGISWLLNGLEVTVVGSLGPSLQHPDALGLSASQIGWAASAYVGGAVLGALFFGRLADRLAAGFRPGRRARLRHPPRAAAPARKPALADYPWTARRSGTGDVRNRIPCGNQEYGTACENFTACPAHHPMERRGAHAHRA